MKKNWERSLLNQIRSTKLGQLLWQGFCKLINQSHIKRLVEKALRAPNDDSSGPRVSSDMLLLPKIKLDDTAAEKAILLILPFYDPCGTCTYLDSICNDFKNNGYSIDAVVYGKGGGRPASKLWRRAYHIQGQADGYLEAPKGLDGEITSANHALDDWAGDDLIQFVGALTSMVEYKICITSYVYLSRALTVVPSATQKVITTIDVFTDRNARIRNTTDSDEGYLFSISAEDEAKGLSRADLVVAITDADSDHFVKKLDLPRVITIPFRPASQEDTPQGYRAIHDCLKIGFIGGANRPNAAAILSFITSTEHRRDFELYVAGDVASQLEMHNFSGNIHIMGRVDNLADFYSNCDVIVNPDTFGSGQKIKCVEALSFDKPLICTVAASEGLNPTSIFHRAKSVKECADLTLALADEPTQLYPVYLDSKELYERFLGRYPLDSCRRIEDAARSETPLIPVV